MPLKVVGCNLPVAVGSEGTRNPALTKETGHRIGIKAQAFCHLGFLKKLSAGSSQPSAPDGAACRGLRRMGFGAPNRSPLVGAGPRPGGAGVYVLPLRKSVELRIDISPGRRLRRPPTDG